MIRAGLAAAALAAALLAGCGGEDGGPTDATPEQREEIEATISSYEKALADGDGEAGCATFAPAEVDSVGGEKACIEFFEQGAEQGAGELLGGERRPIERIEIADTGELARVYYEGEEAFTRLVLVDGKWYLSPTAEPPPSS